MPEPIVQVTEYAVSCLPESHPDAHCWTIRVEYRGEGRWAVTDRHRYLSAAGNWSHGYMWRDGSKEPVTDEEYAECSAGMDAWTAEHRHDLDTALRLAREAAPLMTVNGWTVEAALARWEAT